eukprot:116511_1
MHLTQKTQSNENADRNFSQVNNKQQYIIKLDGKAISILSCILVLLSVINFMMWNNVNPPVSNDKEQVGVSESWATSHCIGLDYLQISNLISGWYYMIELISTKGYDERRFEQFVSLHFDDSIHYHINTNTSWNNKTSLMNEESGIRQYFGRKFWNFIIISGIPYIDVNLTGHYATANLSSLFSFSPSSAVGNTTVITPFKSDGLISSNWYFIRRNNTWLIKNYRQTLHDSSKRCTSDVAIAPQCSLKQFHII